MSSKIPILSGLPPEGTPYNWGGPSHINQGKEDNSSGEAHYSGNFNLWQVDIKINHNLDMFFAKEQKQKHGRYIL